MVGEGDGAAVGEGDGVAVGEGDGVTAGEGDGVTAGEGDDATVGEGAAADGPMLSEVERLDTVAIVSDVRKVGIDNVVEVLTSKKVRASANSRSTPMVTRAHENGRLRGGRCLMIGVGATAEAGRDPWEHWGAFFSACSLARYAGGLAVSQVSS